MNIDKFGWEGVMVRLSDKIERLINMWKKSKNRIKTPLSPENESALDTWQDICNYGAIGYMCHTGLWQQWRKDAENDLTDLSD